MKRICLTILVSLLAIDAAIASAHAASAPLATSAAPQAEAGPSIYPLALDFVDQDAAALHLDVFRGHPVVVTMFYGSCPVACPLLATHIRAIEASLPPDVRADLRVLVVSFDPQRDTPEALRAIAARRHLDLGRWKLATASDDQARQLAAALGITYHRLPDGSFSHTSVLTVLDRDGRPLARTDDLGADSAPLVRALREAHGP